MKEWFTIEQIDSQTFSISEYRHWEESHNYLLNGEEYGTNQGLCCRGM